MFEVDLLEVIGGPGQQKSKIKQAKPTIHKQAKLRNSCGGQKRIQNTPTLEATFFVLSRHHAIVPNKATLKKNSPIVHCCLSVTHNHRISIVLHGTNLKNWEINRAPGSPIWFFSNRNTLNEVHNLKKHVHSRTCKEINRDGPPGVNTTTHAYLAPCVNAAIPASDRLLSLKSKKVILETLGHISSDEPTANQQKINMFNQKHQQSKKGHRYIVHMESNARCESGADASDIAIL